MVTYVKAFKLRLIIREEIAARAVGMITPAVLLSMIEDRRS